MPTKRDFWLETEKGANAKPHIQVGFFFFSLVFDIFFPDQDWRRGEGSREKRLEGGGEKGIHIEKEPLEFTPASGISSFVVEFLGYPAKHYHLEVFIQISKQK